MPDFDYDQALTSQVVSFTCKVCGGPLIYGGQASYFEFGEINPESGAVGAMQVGRDHSEGYRVRCRHDEGHDIGWTDEQREEFDEGQ